MNKPIAVLAVLLCCLTAVIIASAYQSYLLCEEVKVLESRISETSEEFDEHMDDIYLLMKMDSSRLYTIMDTEVRILHYAKPHQHPAWACPECAEQKDREKLNAQKEKEVSGENRHK